MANLSNTTNTFPALFFMKFFITFMWFEPLFCEIFLGLLLFIFPTNDFVINSFVHTPLFHAMKQSVAIHDSLAFLMRFISMLLTTFGCLHFLILLTCDYHRKTIESQKKWSSNRLFNILVSVLLVGDCFHVLCVFTLEGSLNSQIVYQLPLTIFCVMVRSTFLILNKLNLVSDY